MLIEIGHVEAIFRYPVKSMRGEQLEVANLGWHGIDGDRRLAFRRIDDRSGLPWLTAVQASRPAPVYSAAAVKTVLREIFLRIFARRTAKRCSVFGEDLAKEVGRRYGAPVQMMQLNHGIFDEASISCDRLRYGARDRTTRRAEPGRATISPECCSSFVCDRFPSRKTSGWAVCSHFGEGEDAPAIAVTTRDVRCSMVNLDPDSASPAPEVLKAVVRANQNNGGNLGAVTRIGGLAVGQPILLRPATGKRSVDLRYPHRPHLAPSEGQRVSQLTMYLKLRK